MTAELDVENERQENYYSTQCYVNELEVLLTDLIAVIKLDDFLSLLLIAVGETTRIELKEIGFKTQ
jgi:hypothetical protein